MNFYLLDSKVPDFKVNLKDNNQLELTSFSESKQESKSNNDATSQYLSGSYEEATTAFRSHESGLVGRSCHRHATESLKKPWGITKELVRG